MYSRPRLLLLVLLALFALLASTIGCGSDDTSSTTQQVPVPDLGTIAAARALPIGKLAKIEGFVTVAPGTFTSSTADLGFALQDDTGGIYVNLYEYVELPLGTKVLLLGQVFESNGLKMLATNKSGVVNEMEISEVMPADVKTGDISESTEGKLVRVTGKISSPLVEDRDKDTGTLYGVKTYVDDGSGEVEVYVNLNNKNEPLLDKTLLVVDAMVEITGFSQQYNMTYEIAPRLPTDLVVK